MFMYMELCMLEGVGGLHCFIYIFTVTLSRTRTSLWLAAAAAAAVHQPIPLNVHTHTCSLKARRTDRPKRNRNQLRRCTIRIYNMRSFESLITTMFAYTYNLWVHLSSSMQSRSSETVCGCLLYKSTRARGWMPRLPMRVCAVMYVLSDCAESPGCTRCDNSNTHTH